MKRSIGPSTILPPHPVVVVGTYDEKDKPNIMAVSWTGICCSEPPCVGIALREATYTHGAVKKRKAFCVCIPTQKYVKEADYVGIASGRDVDKFDKTGLTPVKSETVDAPYVDEFPIALECKLLHTLELGLHTLFVGQIMDVMAEKDVLGDKGLPDTEKVNPFVWGSHGTMEYFALGEKLGRAFKIGRQISGDQRPSSSAEATEDK